MSKPVNLLCVVPFISMFLPLLKTRRNWNVSVYMYVLCRHNFPTQADCIIFFFFCFYCQFSKSTTSWKFEYPRMFLKARTQKTGPRMQIFNAPFQPQICRGTVLSGNVLILGRIARQTVFLWTRVYGYSDAHSLRRSPYMFVTIFKLTTFIILKISCEKKKKNA